MKKLKKKISGYITLFRKKVFDFGTNHAWDPDKRRVYRQVNAFNLYMAMISFSAWSIALAFQVYLGLAIQVIGFLCYLWGFHLVSAGKINTARSMAIYTFEAHMFIVSLFALIPTTSGFLPWYSPVFISYMLFPITAALFDKSILKHMMIALGQIILMQFIGGILSRNSFPSFPDGYHDILNVIICIYTIGMTSIIIYILYSETYTVKNKEIERSLKLKEQVTEVLERKEIFRREADELKLMNDSKNKLFSILAHDLKSPFNVMLGFSSLLQDMSVKDPEYHHYAKRLYEASLINYNLLENLLEWSRSQLDHISHAPAEIRINDIISESLQVTAINAERKDITLINNVEDTLCVNADKSLLSIVIRNIISNAIKFTFPGGRIIIASRIIDNYAEISIADNGMGMPAEMLKNLFAVEKMNSRNGTASEKGTGLGLIICKEFVEKNGGRLWVKSEEYKGSTFYFTVPLAIVSAPVE